MCMLALPAPYHVNPEKTAAVLGVREACLGDEERFAETFPDCEVGAMPPFENKRMFNLLKDLGLPETLRYEDGIEHVEIELQRPGAEEGS